ncbi:MAG: hypothetical protein H0V47_01800 [Chloroflexia bacterium]|nr:hypothetical protein [Chloroflexia bacterium]
MKLDPTTTQAEIKAVLRNQSDLVYGAQRTQELASQIEHLSTMLAEVIRRPLDLTGPAPDSSGILSERS